MQKPQTDPDGFSLAFMAEGKADADFHNSETLTIKARIVRCKPESERTQRDGTGKGPVVRNCSMDETFAKTGLMLDRLAVSAIVSPYWNGSRSHGFRVEYEDCFLVDLERSRRMYKTLETIERRLKKESEENGPVVSFFDFMMRVGRSIGIRRAVYELKRSGSSYEENEYSIRPDYTLQEHIQNEILLPFLRRNAADVEAYERKHAEPAADLTNPDEAQ